MAAVHFYHTYDINSGPAGIPSNAVHAGHDVDGSTIFLGRAQFMSDLVPAKVIPAKRAAYIPYNGQEMQVNVVEVLCMGPHTWRASRNGEIPVGAFNVGTAANGEWLFAGRAHHQGSLTPGKVHPTHNCMYIPFGGKEVPVYEYEVLCTE